MAFKKYGYVLTEKAEADINETFEYIAYVSVFAVDKNKGYGHKTNAKAKHYITYEDFRTERDAGYVYIQIPKNGYTGDNYIVNGVDFEYFDDMENSYPVLIYDRITPL